MIQRSRANIQIPQTLSSNECSADLLNIIRLISTGIADEIKAGKKSIASKFYRGEIVQNGVTVQDVVIALSSLYDYKCAFCESKRHHPDIEHYRPKKNVTGIAGHIGYYWLCYEWTNLLPTCSDCNDAKHTSFPIRNNANRIYGPTFLIDHSLNTQHNRAYSFPLVDERPVLLHPEYDDPEVCFSFNSIGEISGIDAEGRGEETKRICGLNRKDLCFFRQQEIDAVVEKFEMALYYNQESYYFIDVLEKIRKRGLNNQKPYTLLYKNIYNRFSEIITPLLPIPVQATAEGYYIQNVNYI